VIFEPCSDHSPMEACGHYNLQAIFASSGSTCGSACFVWNAGRSPLLR
jgi:hypothetical protein